MKTIYIILIASLLGVTPSLAQTPAKPQLGLAVEALSLALRDPDAGVRQAAVMALHEIGPEAVPAIPFLAERFHDQDGYIRIDAAHALGRLGAPAVPALAALLNDRDSRVRELAARTLREVGPASVGALSTLIARLKDPDVDVRQATVAALRELGPAAIPAIPALGPLLHDQDGYIGIDVGHGLGRLGTASIPTLALELRDPDVRARVLAASALRQVGGDVAAGISPAAH